MRPAGEISKALLQAVEKTATAERGLTLREMADLAGVPACAARHAVGNMKRYGRLVMCGERKVPGRNRPAAEYGLPQQQDAANDAVMDLAAAMRMFGG